MRIAIDARFLGRDRRGMGRYVTALTAALLDRETDHEFLLLTDGDGSAGMAERISAGRSRCAVLRISAGRRAGIDVCWCPWGRADASVPGAATVVTIHDLAAIVFPPRGIWRTLDRAHDVRRLRDAIERADRLVTCSEFIRQELATRLGVDPARVVAIPEGIDRVFLGTLGSPPPADGPLLWVGTDEERKNLPRLLEAFDRVRQDHREIRLVLCGDTSPRLVHYLAAAGLDGAVIVPGYLPDEVLGRLYRSARLFVFPSLYEGFGLPVLEAMASGTPVVCSNAASLPEVAGDAAFYFDPRDANEMSAAIGRCLDDDGLRASLAARGRVRAQGFTWETAARRLLTVLEETLATSPASTISTLGQVSHV